MPSGSSDEDNFLRSAPRQAASEMRHRKAMGKRLALARDAQGLTHEGLAQLKAVPRVAVASFERGMRVMRSFDVIEFARILKCDPGWLLTGKGDPPEEVW